MAAGRKNPKIASIEAERRKSSAKESHYMSDPAEKSNSKYGVARGSLPNQSTLVSSILRYGVYILSLLLCLYTALVLVVGGDISMGVFSLKIVSSFQFNSSRISVFFLHSGEVEVVDEIVGRNLAEYLRRAKVKKKSDGQVKTASASGEAKKPVDSKVSKARYEDSASMLIDFPSPPDVRPSKCASKMPKYINC